MGVSASSTGRGPTADSLGENNILLAGLRLRERGVHLVGVECDGVETKVEVSATSPPTVLKDNSDAVDTALHPMRSTQEDGTIFGKIGFPFGCNLFL